VEKYIGTIPDMFFPTTGNITAPMPLASPSWPTFSSPESWREGWTELELMRELLRNP